LKSKVCAKRITRIRQQSPGYLEAQLSIPNEKDLIQSKESYIATGFIAPREAKNWKTACAGVA
jgi:hypothetical protein